MRRVSVRTLKSLSCLVAAAVASLLMSTSGVQAQAGSAVAGPPPRPIQWIIIGGSVPDADIAVGVQIVSRSEFTGEEVFPEDNPISKADGFIRAPHEGFCDCTHYHGVLRGFPDPDEKFCGWGCVIPAEIAPPGMVPLSDALMLQISANMKADDSDLDGAIADLQASKELLKEANQNKPRIGEEDWDENDKKELAGTIKAAKKLDGKAIHRLKKAKQRSGQRRTDLINEAIDLTLDAIEAKRHAISLISNELNLNPEEDDD